MDKNISGLVFAVLIGLTVFIGMGNFLGGLATVYNKNPDTTFINESKKQIDQLNETSQNMKEALKKPADSSWSLFDKLFGGFKLFIAAVSGLMNLVVGGGPVAALLSLPSDMLGGTAGVLIPGWFMAVLIIMATLIVLFGLLNWGRGSGKI